VGDDQGLDAEVTLRHPFERRGGQGEDTRDRDGGDRLGIEALVSKQLQQQDAVLVGGLFAVALNPPVGFELFSLVDPQRGVGVSDVDDQEHVFASPAPDRISQDRVC